MVSVYPCDVHGARIRGPLEGIRVTLLSHSDRYSRRLRVCPPDLDQILSTHEREWEHIEDEGLAAHQQVCSACAREPQGPEDRFDCFVYVWRRSTPQSEYYGIYCSKCGGDLISTFGLAQEQASTP